MKTEKGSITFAHDEFSDAPWENSDGHGNEMLADLIAQVATEKRNIEYWNSRDVCTV